MSSIWRLYQKSLNKYPVLTQAFQTSILMGTGDVICQTLVEKKHISSIDVKRTAQFSAVGLFIGGPGLRMWYGILNKYVGNKGTTVVVKKVVLDQFIFAPIFIGLLLGSIGAMKGQSSDEIILNVKHDYPDVLKNNYLLWPWVQLANFYLVPLNYQVLTVQVVAIFWNSYISWKTNQLKSIHGNHH